MIHDHSTGDKAKRAMTTLSKICNYNANTPYGQREKELLALALRCVLVKGTPELKDYMVDQLSDADTVCAHGRATRLADTIALA